MVKGPAMLLPDPRTEVIVRRVLSDQQVQLLYPGNEEARQYNEQLRTIMQVAPTTRQGAISEGDVARNSKRENRSLLRASSLTTDDLIGSTKSLVGSEQGLIADEFSRASTYTQPRTVTLDTKYQGVPAVDVWTGYAVMVVSKTGKRRVEQGPTTVLLDYDESMEALSLSTGTPKTTDKLFKTAFLRMTNNKVSDIIQVETSDHVMVSIKLSLKVDFEGDSSKWFNIDNYVKFLCDHVRSVLKGAVKKIKVEDFYANSVAIIRDTLLGKAGENEGKGKRTGMKFDENGMRLLDVEVFTIKIGDDSIREMLERVQHSVVETNIEVFSMKRELEATKDKENIAREELEIKTKTTQRRHELERELAASELALTLTKIANSLKENAEKKMLEAEKQKVSDISFDADQARKRRSSEQEQSLAQIAQAQKIEMLKAEAEAVAQRFNASMPGFSEALLALSNNETMVKVAEAWNIQRAIGGENLSDAIKRIFDGTQLSSLVGKLASNTNGSNGTSNGTKTKIGLNFPDKISKDT